MLSLSFIKEHTQEVKQRLRVKRFKDGDEIIDSLVTMYDQKKTLLHSLEEAQASVNQLSKKIGSLLAQAQNADKEKEDVALLKEQIKTYTTELSEIDRVQTDLLLQVPNLPSHLVPVGASAKDNIVLRQGGEQLIPLQNGLPHWDLCDIYHLVDFELGAKVTGTGFPFYIGQGAKLLRSLVQYFLDFNIAAGYEEHAPPLLVNEQSAYGTGQLPDKEAQMYSVPGDGLYLIPTSEVPLTNIYRDELIPADKLPIKITAHSACFRREAGSYGKDVRGLNRLHQFDKVEIVQITQPSQSYAALDEMVLHVERLVQSLELPYRILRLCGGDMGFASALTYDFEVYSAVQGRWLEVSSVSNFEAFQTNRMKIRHKHAQGKTELLHSLNGSALALPRIIATLLENKQTKDGILLPKCLHTYFGNSLIKRVS